MLPKTTVFWARNGPISPPKRSAMVSATIFKASGLPAYRSTRRARSSWEPTTSFSASRCSHAAVSNPARHNERTGLRLLSSAHSSARSEEHTSELQSHSDLVCRLLLEKKKKQQV